MKNRKILFKVLILVIIIIGIIIGNYFYNEYNYFEKWLICDYNSVYQNYEETIKFNYIENTLYEYVREEVMRPSGSTTLDELVEFFNGEREKVEEYQSDNFKYEVTEGKDEVKIYTYIKTLFNDDFYNSYIKEKNITMTSTIEEIEQSLADEYTCHIEKVR